MQDPARGGERPQRAPKASRRTPRTSRRRGRRPRQRQRLRGKVRLQRTGQAHEQACPGGQALSPPAPAHSGSLRIECGASTCSRPHLMDHCAPNFHFFPLVPGGAAWYQVQGGPSKAVKCPTLKAGTLSWQRRSHLLPEGVN